MKKLIFLCLAIAIVLLSIIVLNLAPVINGIMSNTLYDNACKEFADIYKYREKLSVNEFQTRFSTLGITNEDKKKEYLDLLKEGKNKCYRDKAMIGLEYAAFNINVVFGATCSILGLLLYLGVANNNGKIIGIIGLITGVVGFVLTLTYVIESGIVITSDVPGKSFNSISTMYSGAEPKIDSDGALFKWDEGKKSYVCIYYDKDNKDSLFLKIKDLGNKYLSYLTKANHANEEENWEYGSYGCKATSLYSLGSSGNNGLWEYCKESENKEHQTVKRKYYGKTTTQEKGECDKLFYVQNYSSNGNINRYNKIITTYIFSVFIVVLHIGLAIFSFLLFKDSGDSSNVPVTIK